jgi:hypothetical protein
MPASRPFRSFDGAARLRCQMAARHKNKFSKGPASPVRRLSAEERRKIEGRLRREGALGPPTHP